MTPRTLRLVERAYVVAAVVATAWLLLQCVPEWQKDWKIYPWDGKVDWIVARAWFAGTNPYSPEALHAVRLDSLGHPPSTAFYMLPLASLGMQEMSPVLGQIFLLILLGSLIAASRELELPSPILTGFLVFAAMNWTRWMHYHLYLAQISGLIACVILFGWLYLRRGNDLVGGAFLGYACTLKLYPGLLVLSLLLAKRVRAVVAACVVWLIVAATMTARFGLIAWPQYFASEKPMVNMWIGHLHNASLYGVLLRLIHPACRGKAPANPVVMTIVPLVGLALFALAWWVGRRAWRTLVELDLAFAVVLVLATFLNPFTFEHYFSLEVLPLLIAVREVWRAHKEGASLKLTGPIVAGLVAVVALLAVDIWAKDVAQQHLPAMHLQLHLLEVANWLHLPILLALLMVLLRRRERVVANQPPALAATLPASP